MSRADFSHDNEPPKYHGKPLVPVCINGMTVWVQPGVSTKQYRPGFARRLLDALGVVVIWAVVFGVVIGGIALIVAAAGW